MTCAREANIEIHPGFNEEFDVLVTTPVLDPVSGKLVDEPVNLDGWMLRLELNKTADPTFALVKSTVNGGIEILDQEENRGTARVHTLPLDTALLSRLYEWRVRGWDPSGAVRLVQRRTARAI